MSKRNQYSKRYPKRKKLKSASCIEIISEENSTNASINKKSLSLNKDQSKKTTKVVHKEYTDCESSDKVSSSTTSDNQTFNDSKNILKKDSCSDSELTSLSESGDSDCSELSLDNKKNDLTTDVKARCFLCLKDNITSCEDCDLNVCHDCNIKMEYCSEIKHFDSFNPKKCFYCCNFPNGIDKILTIKKDNNGRSLYLIKFQELSYHEVAWVFENWLELNCSQKLRNFKRKLDQLPKPPTREEVIKPSFLEPELIFHAKFKSQKGPIVCSNTMVLIKWSGLSYENATWMKWSSIPKEHKVKCKKLVKRYIDSLSITPCKIQRNRKGFKALDEHPDYIKGVKLYQYQLDGLNWLYYKWTKNQPSILADEMGLGKTIQIIALIYTIFLKHNIYPFLLVVPKAVLQNWKREFDKLAPEMIVAIYAGQKKSLEMIDDSLLFQNDSIKAHVLLTTYDTLNLHTNVFAKIKGWEMVILDESQRIKNSLSKSYNALLKVRSYHKLLITGTPLQNNLEELYNIMCFLDPDSFLIKEKSKYLENNEILDEVKIKKIHEELKPYFLRRVKEDVMKEVPPKIERIIPVTMTKLQREYYKALLKKNSRILASSSFDQKINEVDANRNLTSLLIDLRHCINHPYIFKELDPSLNDDFDEEANKWHLRDASAKLIVVDQILKVLKQQNHKVLIFSQFNLVLDILEDYCADEGHRYVRLDGSTSFEDRQANIDEFNDKDSDLFIFLLTTRAGGTGINLTSADTVIIYDLDFNPQQDIQALNRAHRIGQTKKVLVLRLVTRGTVEEKMFEIAKQKLVLEHLVIGKMGDAEVKESDIKSIIRFGAKALFDENSPINEISYSEEQLKSLLDRDAVEEPASDKKESISSQPFGFSRIWQADEEAQTTNEHLDKLDDQFWDSILKLAIENKKEEEKLGRGARRRKKTNYKEVANSSSESDLDHCSKKNTKKKKEDSDKEYSAKENLDSESDGEAPNQSADIQINKFKINQYNPQNSIKEQKPTHIIPSNLGENNKGPNLIRSLPSNPSNIKHIGLYTQSEVNSIYVGVNPNNYYQNHYPSLQSNILFQRCNNNDSDLNNPRSIPLNANAVINPKASNSNLINNNLTPAIKIIYPNVHISSSFQSNYQHNENCTSVNPINISRYGYKNKDDKDFTLREKLYPNSLIDSNIILESKSKRSHSVSGNLNYGSRPTITGPNVITMSRPLHYNDQFYHNHSNQTNSHYAQPIISFEPNNYPIYNSRAHHSYIRPHFMHQSMPVVRKDSHSYSRSRLSSTSIMPIYPTHLRSEHSRIEKLANTLPPEFNSSYSGHSTPSHMGSTNYHFSSFTNIRSRVVNNRPLGYENRNQTAEHITHTITGHKIPICNYSQDFSIVRAQNIPTSNHLPSQKDLSTQHNFNNLTNNQNIAYTKDEIQPHVPSLAGLIIPDKNLNSKITNDFKSVGATLQLTNNTNLQKINTSNSDTTVALNMVPMVSKTVKTNEPSSYVHIASSTTFPRGLNHNSTIISNEIPTVRSKGIQVFQPKIPSSETTLNISASSDQGSASLRIFLPASNSTNSQNLHANPSTKRKSFNEPISYIRFSYFCTLCDATHETECPLHRYNYHVQELIAHLQFEIKPILNIDCWKEFVLWHNLQCKLEPYQGMLPSAEQLRKKLFITLFDPSIDERSSDITSPTPAATFETKKLIDRAKRFMSSRSYNASKFPNNSVPNSHYHFPDSSNMISIFNSNSVSHCRNVNTDDETFKGNIGIKDQLVTSVTYCSRQIQLMFTILDQLFVPQESKYFKITLHQFIVYYIISGVQCKILPDILKETNPINFSQKIFIVKLEVLRTLFHNKILNNIVLKFFSNRELMKLINEIDMGRTTIANWFTEEMKWIQAQVKGSDFNRISLDSLLNKVSDIIKEKGSRFSYYFGGIMPTDSSSFDNFKPNTISQPSQFDSYNTSQAANPMASTFNQTSLMLEPQSGSIQANLYLSVDAQPQPNSPLTQSKVSQTLTPLHTSTQSQISVPLVNSNISKSTSAQLQADLSPAQNDSQSVIQAVSPIEVIEIPSSP